MQQRRVVFFGDSIMSGEYVSPHLHWVTRISSQLPDNWLMINSSVPGDTTRMALERMPRDVQKYNPDILIVQFGMNDCNRWQTDNGIPRVSKSAFEANLFDIAHRGEQMGAKLLFMTSHPSLKSGRYEVDRAEYNQVVRGIKYAPVIDIARELSAISRASEYLLDDGVHINRLGHELYSRIVWEAICEYFF